MRFDYMCCEGAERPDSCQKVELDNQLADGAKAHSTKASSEYNSNDCCDRNKLNDSFGFYGMESDCDDEEKGSIPKVPKVYYGTRTHKQIEQVIRELKKTSYKYKRMTILSSREHTCIQQTERNKTELCNELLDPAKPKRCPFYNEGNKRQLASYSAVEMYGLESPWDIEDLVKVGNDAGACPYFAARNLMAEAEIIFCPYNYLIDPDIRQSMQISLKGEIIILDEAHNIEDICREAASVNFREDHINVAANECDALAKQRTADSGVYEILKNYFLGLEKFLKITGVERIDTSENLSSPRWTGAELMELLDMHDIGRSQHPSFFAAGKAAIMHFTKAKEDLRPNQTLLQPIISNATKRLLEQLAFALEMIASKDFANDYRACVTESLAKDVQYVADDTWHSSRKIEQRVRTLKLICMNPGVIFTPLATAARSIILASGTLAPTSSFQSELGTKFPHMLSANHVIPKDQVYVRCIPRGPTGVPLKANYQNVNSWSFQDELGKLIVDVCQSVPYGVLCFFSSYHVMHTQIERWRNSGTWSKLECLKEIFLEPRFGGDLAKIMKDYRDAIKTAAEQPERGISGALLFAVFRGKVAEGIDFSDNEARCVMSIGIPYAVRKDPIVEMKYNYNDINTSKGLLKGGEWYTVQAFRALNQALGRCVRHKNDWGAVLLVDERFQMQYNINYLPKWIKSMWIDCNRYNLKEELHRFVIRQVERESQKSSA
ncbi:hypothetical protein KM043_003400 [Ampulex compressa]|nr:hypothetical protein KM043_003400 [Ampulex compressa]